MVFVPFHWGDLFGEGNAANYLTISAIGRVAKQPELKFCAVNLEKVPAPRGETNMATQSCGHGTHAEAELTAIFSTENSA